MRVLAPGRVNLIGDHTDYTGGMVLPMAIDLATTVTGVRGGRDVRLSSADADGDAVVSLRVTDPSMAEPPWARYVAGVVSVLKPRTGFTGRVSTSLPVGAGLSSSAALEVAVALALGFSGSALELSRACQEAEHAASGVPCGVMDQLACAAGIEGHALLIDCSALTIKPILMPDHCEVVVVDSRQPRRLADSAYAERRRSCQIAQDIIGPLAHADEDAVARIADPVVQARARHVVTENGRVRAFAAALTNDDLAACGALMKASHQSLRADFQVSTARLDQLAAELNATPGVFGARLTGAGFGGCLVALARPGALGIGWRVRAAQGARVVADDP